MAVFKRESLITARRMLPPPKGVIDLAAERARLDKELTKADGDSGRVDARLGNEKFAANARRKSSRKNRRKSSRKKKKARSRGGAEGKDPRSAGAAEESRVGHDLERRESAFGKESFPTERRTGARAHKSRLIGAA
jgi:hypothetical protein